MRWLVTAIVGAGLFAGCWLEVNRVRELGLKTGVGVEAHGRLSVRRWRSSLKIQRDE